VVYAIRHALREDTNDGWVWICGPTSQSLKSRTVVKVRYPSRSRYFYAEVRKIEENFLRQYNDPKQRICINCDQNTIVMAEWYRSALGIKDISKSNSFALVVTPAKLWGWKSLRAACHHPDPVVRLSTRLGVLGAWLGLLGVWLSLWSAWLAQPCQMWLSYSVSVASVALVLAGVFGACACLGLRRRG
jgi:hypothetical protein